MKFISFAILSALATLTTAAPAPSQGQCNPNQGQRFNEKFDLTGQFTFNECANTLVHFISGTIHFNSAFNSVDNGDTITFCSKHHTNMQGAKVLCAAGNRYNVMQIDNGNSESTFTKANGAFESDFKNEFRVKFVGQGPLTNSVFRVSVDCHNSFHPDTGFQQTCKKNEVTFKCSA